MYFRYNFSSYISTEIPTENTETKFKLLYRFGQTTLDTVLENTPRVPANLQKNLEKSQKFNLTDYRLAIRFPIRVLHGKT